MSYGVLLVLVVMPKFLAHQRVHASVETDPTDPLLNGKLARCRVKKKPIVVLEDLQNFRKAGTTLPPL